MTIIVRPVSFDEIWPGVEILGQWHFSEVNPTSRRQYVLNVDLLRRLNASGHLVIIGALEAGQVIGYFTWSLVPDVESSTLVADQGAWYVEPGRPGLALRMFDCSIEALKALGIRCIFPHHHLVGRGRGLGKFFQRHGAKPSKQVYELWIGD